MYEACCFVSQFFLYGFFETRKGGMVGAFCIEIWIGGLIGGFLLGGQESGSIERFHLVQGVRDQL